MNDVVNASSPAPINMAKEAENRREATISSINVGLAPNGDRWGIICICTEAEHTPMDLAKSEGGVELEGSGANLLGSKVNAPAAKDSKESISTLPLTTNAYIWVETTLPGLIATFTT